MNERKFDDEVERRRWAHFWRNYYRVQALPHVTLEETLQHIRTAFKGHVGKGASWNDMPYKNYRTYRLVNPGFGMPTEQIW